MSHFVALAINNKKHVPCAAGPFSEDLFLPPNRGGWGLGYYETGELLSRIEPREEESPRFDAGAIISAVEAEILVLHTREASVGAVRRENTHPFRFQNWMMAHNGTLEGFADYKDKIIDAMPPYIRRGLRGDTDSEHLFHLFLSFLYDAGKMNRSNIGTKPIRNALRQSVSTIDAFAESVGLGPSDLSVVISDGYSIVVLGRGVPVNYALVEGVRGCEFCRSSNPPGSRGAEADHNELRAVLVRSGPSNTGNEAFQILEDANFLSITTDCKLEFNPMVAVK